VLTVLATVIGVATSLGFGAMQINGGLNYLFGIPNNSTVQLIIIGITTVCFIASSLSGISRGVRWLSNANVILAVAFVLAARPLRP
jgi:glycine betaine transporter